MITQKSQASSLEIRDETFHILNELPSESSDLTTFAKVSLISWSITSNSLAGASCDQVSGACFLWTWDIQTNKFVTSFRKEMNPYIENDGTFIALSFNPDGRLLAANDVSGTNYIWDTSTGNVLSSLDGKKGWMTTFSWNPDGMKLATGTKEGIIRIWQAEN